MPVYDAVPGVEFGGDLIQKERSVRRGDDAACEAPSYGQILEQYSCAEVAEACCVAGSRENEDRALDGGRPAGAEAAQDHPAPLDLDCLDTGTLELDGELVGAHS